MNSSNNSSIDLRLIFGVLITVVVGSAAGRILSVARIYEPYLYKKSAEDKLDPRGVWPAVRPEPMPTHGDNDRSRWATIRALVDHNTYAIGERRFHQTGFTDSGIVTEDGWRSIDKVKHPETHKYYSSKPPLLPTLAAGEYWLLKKLFGWSIVEERWKVVRAILLTVNVLPMAIYLWLLGRLLIRFGSTDWGRTYVFAAACFGSLITPFIITLNNHTVAAFSALFALYPAMTILFERRDRWCHFFWSGFFAGFTACNEFPAASFAFLLGSFLFLRSPSKTLAAFLPGILLPLGGHVVTNYLAIGEWRPAYDFFGSPWYEFEGSFWRLKAGEVKQGIDWVYQKESRATYAFHVLVGHHGIFSLSPVFLFAFIGMFLGSLRWMRESSARPGTETVISRGRLDAVPFVPLLTLLTTIIVLGFYILWVNDRNRNYGGWTNGLRWLMWLTPLWLLSMLPVVDWLSKRVWGRWLSLACLAVSVFSVNYQSWNPWRHPWLYYWLEELGWLQY